MKEYTKEQCIKDTEEHIDNVKGYMHNIMDLIYERSMKHDASKMQEPELGIFVEYTPKLANTTYGSDEYKEHLKGMQVALKHHYANNSHHVEWGEYNKEEWRDIKGYEGIYQVNNYGDVKSLARKVKRPKQGDFNVEETLLKQHVTPKGYLRLQLTKKGKTKNYLAHRLVAKAFIPNPENKAQINHINTNKQDNCVDNLEWATNSENQLHAYEVGLQKIKYIVICPELDLITMGTGNMERKLKELGYENANGSNILSCMNEENQTHLGLKFEGYKVEEKEKNKFRHMSLLDVIEMLCDWKAATERHNDGDIMKSMEINKERFGIDDQLYEILLNTIKELGM